MTNQSGEYNCPQASPLVYDHKSLSTVVYLLHEQLVLATHCKLTFANNL